MVNETVLYMGKGLGLFVSTYESNENPIRYEAVVWGKGWVNGQFLKGPV